MKTTLISLLVCASIFLAMLGSAAASQKAPLLSSLKSSNSGLKRNSWNEKGVANPSKYVPIDRDDDDFRVVAANSAPESFWAKDSTKGLLCILGGALMHITLGSLYCWGNFISYSPAHLKFFDGKSHPGESPDALLVLPMTLVAQCFTMPFGAKLAAKCGSRTAMIIGAAIVSSGVFLSSYASNLAAFILTYAGLFGAGVGLSYTSPMMAGWKWMPNKKGLVSGAILTGFGAGGFFFNLIGTKLVNPNSLDPVEGVFPSEVYANFPTMLRKLSMLYLAGGIAGSLLVTEPSKQAANANNKQSSSIAAATPGTGVKESLTTPQFWLMWGMIVFSASAGLNVASTYKQFAASSTALTGDSFQALVGGLGALFNGVGRLFWGQISDSIGFKKSFMGLTLFQAVLHAYYPYTADSKVAYAAATCMCYFFLAGNFALMPPAIQKMFGPKNGALIYGLVYSAFGVASIGGMILGKGLKAQFGLEGVFRALSVMSVFGALLTSRLQPLRSLPSSTV